MPGNAGYRLLAGQVPLMIAPPLGVGSTGTAVRQVQQRLLDLGYWMPAVDGIYGTTTQQAVYAFQKASNLPRTGSVDLATHNRLNTRDAASDRGRRAATGSRSTRRARS